MKYLKLYENFEKDIKKLCNIYDIYYFTINRDGSVDVNSSVDLENRNLKKLPLKFGKIVGSFNCNKNKLISLEGSPNKVDLDFICSNNKLTTLVGGPKIVKQDYICVGNNLKNVHGISDIVGNCLYIGNNPVYEIIDLIDRMIERHKFIKYLNEFNVIVDGNKIFELGLEEAYYMTTKQDLPMSKRNFKNYQLI